ncbi:hypothetical protein NDU88_008647 [Pleurodeles waltl]|uniref:Uncharacterized protein n=1 Tax=Pleurodeles waltl TaxID=8319 RepID=A0AAV7NZY0_PLEWA|nr:hypothetical protein NDU88_008647 [Pleurodeles waltl]
MAPIPRPTCNSFTLRVKTGSSDTSPPTLVDLAPKPVGVATTSDYPTRDDAGKEVPVGSHHWRLARACLRRSVLPRAAGFRPLSLLKAAAEDAPRALDLGTDGNLGNDVVLLRAT